MSNQKSQKRSAGQTGIKALIASASVAATIAGWALLPANDPDYGAAAASATTAPIIAALTPASTPSPADLLQASPTQRPSSTPTITNTVTPLPTDTPAAATNYGG